MRLAISHKREFLFGHSRREPDLRESSALESRHRNASVYGNALSVLLTQLGPELTAREFAL